MPQIGGVDDLSAGAFRRASLEGAMSGLTPAPTKRVHDPSRVATHGVALWSAGDSPFRSARVVMALLVPCLAATVAGRNRLKHAPARRLRLPERRAYGRRRPPTHPTPP
jgi:hypothetical protein